ncbi:MAG: TolC family protein, partial [Kiritimatiellae bacterium]|nr:TolC family protein [Kiritimatiellia bacterium]
MKEIKGICRLLVFLIMAVTLSGCLSVGPDYEQPEIETPDAWGQAIMSDFQAGTNSSMQNWWTVFNDEVLNEMITMSSTNNPDLMIAAERIVEAAALRGIAKSLWFPQITGNGSATRIQVSENIFAQLPDGQNKATQYSIGGSMIWELDLWGRVRRSVESSDASMQA